MAASRDPVVEVAFADTPLTFSPTWTDLTSRLRSLDIDRQYDGLLRRWLTGRATVILDNLDRALEPGYSGSAHYPNVKRRRQLRITVPAYALDLPGTTGHYASTPDTAALDVTGDIDIRVKVAMDDWTPASSPALVAKWLDSGNNRSFYLRLLSTGVLSLIWDQLGDFSQNRSANSTVAVGATDGTVKWVRATLDVNDGAGNRVIKFYTSDDGAVWTQLGTTVTVAGTTMIYAGTAQLVVGGTQNGASQNFAGIVHYAEVRNGIDGTVVASPNFDQPTGTTTFTDDQGLPWTINGASSAFVAATAYPRFRGLIDAIIPTYGANGLDATVELRCIDLAGYLAEVELEVPYVRAVLADTPYGYWRLNEEGTVGSDSRVAASDASGNGHNGVYATAGVTYRQPDAITDDQDGAVTLNGSTGYVGVPPAPVDNLMAVEAWFKSTASADGRIVAQGSTETTDFSLFYDGIGGGVIYFQYGQSATSGIWQCNSSAGYDDGEWHHVVGLVDVDGTDMSIWIDGADDTASSTVTGTPAAASGASSMFIGVSVASAPQHFNGSLSDVAVYSGNHPDIAAHYADRNAGLGDTYSERIERIVSAAGVDIASWLTAGTGSSTMTGAGDMGTQTAIEAARVAELTEAGALFSPREGGIHSLGRDAPHGGYDLSTNPQATYTGSGGGGIEYTGDPQFATLASDFANSVRNVRRNGATVYASDAASIAEDGVRSVSLSTASSTDAEAASRASWELAIRSADEGMRARRLDFVIVPNNASAILGREIWDRVTVEWQPPGSGDPLSQEALVVGIADRWAPGAYRVRLSLDPTETLGVFTWDTSTWGDDTRWFF